MTPTELSTLAIALASLMVSIWVVVRDQRQRKVDMLYQCYERLHKVHETRPFATVSDLVEMDRNPEDPRWDEYRQKSRQSQDAVERELEFACYLVFKEQVNFEMFFYLFRGWL